MNITSLSQLKRALSSGCCFEIIEHHIKPEHTGEVRCVQKMQTNGMYTGISGKPKDPVSCANDGKGYWMGFGKAADWSFENGLCTQRVNGKPIWTIRVIEEEI